MKQAKWSRLQQRERIRELGLKEEEVGKWVQEGRIGDYGQNVWADRVMRLALSMGDTDGTLIEYAIETTLAVLRDHLDDGYDSWEDFVQAVREIPAARLRQGKEELEQNQACDSAIAALRQQVMQLSVWMASQSQQSTPRLSPSPSYSNMFPAAQAYTQGMPVSTTVAGSPQWCNATPLKGQPPPHIPLSRVQIVERVLGIPQRSNMIPVQLVSTYHDEDIGDAPYTFDTSGQGNVTWDWSSASENGGGLQQAADQQ